jgi:putative nucleotidyltransferase with HDIG domain
MTGDVTAKPRTSVAAGEFRVSEEACELLEAHLGTCVAVAIVDRRAHVGGLLHVMLPEAASADQSFGRLLSARHALPLFLEELAAAGCAAGSMEATLAGGALVGRVSSLDLDLDIGGRTVDLLNELLRAAGVEVLSSETGGHFMSTLVLDLETLLCTIETVADDPPEPGARPEPISREEVERAAVRLRPIPQAALKIIRLLKRDDFSLSAIAAEVRQDQVLSARVLQACHAAHLGVAGDITSIDRALMLLGGRVVGNLILAQAMSGFFSQSQHGYSMSRGGLYHHAVSTGLVAEQIAALTDFAEPDLAYTAGLLHDIGKVLLDQYVAAVRPLFYRQVVGGGTALLDAERSILGITHEEAGDRLAALWSIPPVLRRVIAHHSRPAEGEGDPRLTYIVYLSDLLVSRFGSGRDLDRLPADFVAAAMKGVGWKSGSFDDLVGQIRWADLLAPGYA